MGSVWGLRVIGGMAVLILGFWFARLGGNATRRVLSGSRLAISLALQGSLSNFASGVMLLVFRVKDAVEGAGCSLPCPERSIRLERGELAA